MSIKNCRFGPDSGTRTERIGLVPPDPGEKRSSVAKPEKNVYNIPRKNDSDHDHERKETRADENWILRRSA